MEHAQAFLRDWIDRVEAIYCAVSLPPSFRYEGADDGRTSSAVLHRVVLPVLAESAGRFGLDPLLGVMPVAGVRSSATTSAVPPATAS